MTFLELDILRDRLDCDGFDLVYDSGCFHHLAPHRRISYRESLTEMLRSGGLFCICTFTAGLMGSDEDDAALLVQGVLGDGIGYTVDDLTAIFSDLELLDGGAQRNYDGAAAHTFAQSFLTAALFRGATMWTLAARLSSTTWRGPPATRVAILSGRRSLVTRTRLAKDCRWLCRWTFGHRCSSGTLAT